MTCCGKNLSTQRWHECYIDTLWSLDTLPGECFIESSSNSVLHGLDCPRWEVRPYTWLLRIS